MYKQILKSEIRMLYQPFWTKVQVEPFFSSGGNQLLHVQAMYNNINLLDHTVMYY